MLTLAVQYNQNVLDLFEHNLRAHIEHKPMRNVAKLPVPDPAVFSSSTRSTHANPSTTRSSNIVYALRERSSDSHVDERRAVQRLA